MLVTQLSQEIDQLKTHIAMLYWLVAILALTVMICGAAIILWGI